MDNQPNTSTAPAVQGSSSGLGERSPRADSFRARRAERGRAPAQMEEKQFDERTLHIDRVARVVKGGRRFRFRALVVIGDHKGKLGVGIAKGADVTSAVTKATEVAKRNTIQVSMYKGTLPHEARAKVGGADILIMPASAGTGLIAGSVVRTMLEVSGIHNALSKSLGSSNKANTAYAVMDALQSLVPAKDWLTMKSKVESGKSKVVAADAATEEKTK